MKVREAMAQTISTARPDDSIVEAARIMRQEDAGFVPVVDGDRLVGVVTDRDLVVRCIADGDVDPREGRIADVMSTDVVTIAPDDDLETAASAMSENEVRRLPVAEGGKLVGILSHGNLVQATEGSGAGRDATLGVTEGA